MGENSASWRRHRASHGAEMETCKGTSVAQPQRGDVHGPQASSFRQIMSKEEEKL